MFVSVWNRKSIHSVTMEVYYCEWSWLITPEVIKLMMCILPSVSDIFWWTWIASNGFNRSDQFSDNEWLTLEKNHVEVEGRPQNCMLSESDGFQWPQIESSVFHGNDQFGTDKRQKKKVYSLRVDLENVFHRCPM